MKTNNHQTQTGPISMLVLQATPFCNLECTYCYLPDRRNTRVMSERVLQSAAELVFKSGMMDSNLLILWHAGEPLVAGLKFYQSAIALLNLQSTKHSVAIRHGLQTNATLLNREWCDFFADNEFDIGVSFDGPQRFHDRNRRKRRGGGTFDKVKSGIETARTSGLAISVITVLTEEALDHPDEFFCCYRDMGIRRVGFNIDEVSRLVPFSSVGRQSRARFRSFLERFLQLSDESQDPIIVREIDHAERLIGFGETSGWNDLCRPLAVVSVDVSGRIYTFSPELATERHVRYPDGFHIGDVKADSFRDIVAGARYIELVKSVQAGVSLCEETCGYFEVCGGGSPSNKLVENGDFASAETVYCTLMKKTVVDIALERLEKQ